MATTTNFGWETPDDTDLVKDGAAAIRTALGGVDTSFVDLKGGTTGQVLSKASNTDLDYTWVTTDDANAIQNAIVDAKGDLIAASAADTPARLAVGNNGETLVADSSTSTGLKWAKSPNFVGCWLYDTGSTQSIANNTNVAVTYNAEGFDTDGFHSTSTNTSRITIPAGLGGKYLVTFNTLWDLSAAGVRTAKIYLNGVQEFTAYEFNGSASAYVGQNCSVIMNLAAGNYIELFVFQSSGAGLFYYKRPQDFPLMVQYLGA